MNNETLKDRFDKAFYGLLEAGNNLNEVSKKLSYANKLIAINNAKQKQIQQLLEFEV